MRIAEPFLRYRRARRSQTLSGLSSTSRSRTASGEVRRHGLKMTSEVERHSGTPKLLSAGRQGVPLRRATRRLRRGAATRKNEPTIATRETKQRASGRSRGLTGAPQYFRGERNLASKHQT